MKKYFRAERFSCTIFCDICFRCLFFLNENRDRTYSRCYEMRLSTILRSLKNVTEGMIEIKAIENGCIFRENTEEETVLVD